MNFKFEFYLHLQLFEKRSVRDSSSPHRCTLFESPPQDFVQSLLFFQALLDSIALFAANHAKNKNRQNADPATSFQVRPVSEQMDPFCRQGKKPEMGSGSKKP